MRRWFRELRIYIDVKKRGVGRIHPNRQRSGTDELNPYVGHMVQRHELQRREEGKDFMLSRLNCTKF